MGVENRLWVIPAGEFVVKKTYQSIKKIIKKWKKGILVKTVETKLAQKLDEVVKLNGLWESIDGIAFKLVISAVDDTLGEKNPGGVQVKDQESNFRHY